MAGTAEPGARLAYGDVLPQQGEDRRCRSCAASCRSAARRERGSNHNGVKPDLTLDHRHEYLDITDDVSSDDLVAAKIVDAHAACPMSSVILSSPQGAVIGGRSLDRGTAMSFKRFKKSISTTTGGWSGMAAPAVAAAAVHSTAPWYWAIGPLALLAVGFVLRRSRRGGGGPPGQGPFGGS
jgi:hypothetical protein